MSVRQGQRRVSPGASTKFFKWAGLALLLAALGASADSVNVKLTDNTGLTASDGSDTVYVLGFSSASQKYLAVNPATKEGTFTPLPAGSFTIPSYVLGRDVDHFLFDSANPVNGGIVHVFVDDGQHAYSVPSLACNNYAVTDCANFAPGSTLPPFSTVEFTILGPVQSMTIDLTNVDAYLFPLNISAFDGSGNFLAELGMPHSSSITRAQVFSAYFDYMAALGSQGQPWLDMWYAGNYFGLKNPTNYFTYPAAVNNPGSSLNTCFDSELNTFFTTKHRWMGDASGSIAQDTYRAEPVTMAYPGSPFQLQALQLTGEAVSSNVFYIFNPVGATVTSMPSGATGADTFIIGDSTGLGHAVTVDFTSYALPPASLILPNMFVQGVGYGTAAGIAVIDSLDTTRIDGVDYVTSLQITDMADTWGDPSTSTPGKVIAGNLYFSKVPDPSCFISSGTMVFGNMGFFSSAVDCTGADSQAVCRSLERNVVQALSRGVANLGSASEVASYQWGDETTWYPAATPQILYSLFMHTGMIDGAPFFSRPPNAAACARGLTMGMAYGFAYDENPVYVSNQPQVPSKWDGVLPAGTASFELSLTPWGTLYTVAASAGDNGAIAPAGAAVPVAAGGDRAFAIAAAPGYHVADVSVDGASVGPVTQYEFSDAAANHTISASFAPGSSSYTITATAGANGEISPSGAVPVDSGADQTFTVDADAGYRVANVLVDGTSVGTPTSYTFAAVSANHTIAATFAAIPPTVFVITATAGGNGSITPSGEVSVDSGASQSFAIAADPGYQLAGVLVDGTSVGKVPSYVFTDVSANHTIAATFEAIPVTRHTITATAGANGTITPSGAVEVADGASQSFAIAAIANYQIADVLVDNVSVGTPTSYKFTAVAADHTITVTFKAIPPAVFVITATAGANGSITPSGEVSVDSGADRSFVINANPGYQIADVLVDGTSVGKVSSHVFTNVTANHTIAASFAPAPVTKYTITATAGAHGEIAPSGAVSVDSGANQGFTIDADSGYQIADVLVDGASVGKLTRYEFAAVAANHTIAATFAAIPPTVFVITATAGAHGSITPAGEVSVDSGANERFDIAPSSGYQIADVLVDGTSVGAVASYLFTNVTGNHTIAASFQAIPVTRYTITATAGANGTITPSGDVLVDSGADQAFAIAAKPGYKIAAVLVDGASQGAAPSYEFKAVTANHTIAATFAADVLTHTVTFLAGAGGSLVGATTQSVVDGGACSPVTAAPDSGYSFDKWTGSVTSTINPLTVINVTEDMAITANFVDAPVFHVVPGSVFTVNVAEALTAKPKVEIETGVKAKVLTPNKDFKAGLKSFECEWTNERSTPGSHTLLVNTVPLTNRFDIESPSLTLVNPDFGSGAAKTQVTVTGMFFGSKCPKLRMRYLDDKGKWKQANCKVARPYAYTNAKGREGKSVMDVDTGESRLVFTVPRKIDADMEATLTLEFKFAEPLETPFNQ